MEITIRDVLALPELGECVLLRPDVGLDRPVRSVTVMDNARILDFMSEHEILLSNGLAAVGFSAGDWRAFLAGLAAKHAAALFVKLDYYIGSIPAGALDYAAELGLPIVKVPNDYSWVQLSTPIQQMIVEKQFYVVKASFALRETLNHVMLQGGSAGDVCQAAARDLGCEAAVFDVKERKLVCGTGGCRWAAVEPVVLGSAALRGPERRETVSAPLPANGGTVLVARLPDRMGRYRAAYWVPHGRERGAFLPADDVHALAAEVDLLKIEQANNALLLCLFKESELDRISRHFYVDFLNELLDGTLTDRREIAARAQRLGRKVHAAYQLAVCRIDADDAAGVEGRVVAQLRKFAEPAVRDIMVRLRERRLVLFCPVFAKEDRETLARACEVVRTHACVASCFGVSRAYRRTEMKRAYDEALFALSLESIAVHDLVFYEDLGLLRLFERNLRAADVRYLSDFYEHVMGPLLSYDAAHGSCLVETLRVYLMNDCSTSKAAKALYVHENTLRMRIKRIEALTNRTMKSMVDRVDLSVGVIIHNFIERA